MSNIADWIDSNGTKLQGVGDWQKFRLFTENVTNQLVDRVNSILPINQEGSFVYIPNTPDPRIDNVILRKFFEDFGYSYCPLNCRFHWKIVGVNPVPLGIKSVDIRENLLDENTLEITFRVEANFVLEIWCTEE